MRILGGGAGLVIVLAILWGLRPEPHTPIPPALEPTTEQVSREDAGTDVAPLEPIIEGRDARMLEFVGEPMPTMLDVRVGGAGLDADFHARVVGNKVPIAMIYEDEELPTLEVRAISPEGCFWSDVRGDEQLLKMKPGFTLDLTVRAGFGLAVKNATVRFGREVVGFVFENPVLNAQGAVSVGCLPAGRYVLDVRAPGFLTSTQVVDVQGDSRLDVELTRGQTAAGRVKSTNGEAIAGAMMVLESCSEPQICVPHRLLVSSNDGRFEVDDLPFDSIRIRARHPDFETTTFFSGVSDRLELTMEAATERVIRVVDESDRPVHQAQIVWRDSFGEGESALSDVKGQWQTIGIPDGATLHASYRGYTSPDVIVDSKQITLTLKSSQAPSLLVRVNAPEPIVGIEVVRTDDRAKCPVMQLSERDFEVGCAEGKATVRVQMDQGVYTESVPLRHGFTLEVPPPNTHRVRIHGSRFNSSLLVEVDRGLGFAAIGCPWVSDHEARCSIQVWAGGFTPKLRARDGATRAETELKGDETSVELKATKRHRVWVVDAQGSALTGAWLGILDGRGRRYDSATSAGQLPFERVVEDGNSLHLYAVDPRRGDGMLQIDAKEEQTLRLTSRVGESTQSPYLTKTQTEDALGVRLVSDGMGFRFDEVAGTQSAKAGIARGSWWVAAWKESSGVRVVSWTTKGYQEYLIPE